MGLFYRRMGEEGEGKRRGGEGEGGKRRRGEREKRGGGIGGNSWELGGT
jgi:hypothetical protein